MKVRLCLYLMVGAIMLVGCTSQRTPDVGSLTPTDVPSSPTMTDIPDPADHLATLRAEAIGTQSAQATPIPPAVSTMVSSTPRPTEIPIPTGPPVLPFFDEGLVGLTFSVRSAPRDIDFMDVWQVTSEGQVTLVWERLPYGWISPNGERLIYDLDGDIFIQNLETGETTTVTDDAAWYDSAPSWMPGSNRRFFYYRADSVPGWDGYLVLDSLDTAPVILDDFGPAVEWPSFSASGDLVGFGVTPGESDDSAIIYREGVGERALDLLSFERDDVRRVWEMAFSPDGSKVVLDAVIDPQDGDPAATGAFLLLDLVTTTHVEIARYYPPGREVWASELAPKWSSSGDWFVYYLEDLTEEAGLWRYDVGAHTNTRIEDPLIGYVRINTLRISPDDRWVVAGLDGTDVWFVDTETWQVTTWRAFDGLFNVQWIASP